jgi:hypothetical protein
MHQMHPMPCVCKMHVPMPVCTVTTICMPRQGVDHLQPLFPLIKTHEAEYWTRHAATSSVGADQLLSWLARNGRPRLQKSSSGQSRYACRETGDFKQLPSEVVLPAQLDSKKWCPCRVDEVLGHRQKRWDWGKLDTFSWSPTTMALTPASTIKLSSDIAFYMHCGYTQ